METLRQQLTRGNAIFLIIILGIGGSFQSGYQITGLSSPSPFIQCFINSSWYERYKEPPSEETVTVIWSLIVSVYPLGGLLGAISVQFVSGRLGRKKAMIANSVVAIVAAGFMLLSKWAKSFEMIMAARILYGYSSGLGVSVQLMYLGEISPRKIRGMITMTSVIFGSLGKLSAQFFGLSELLGGKELWNILLCLPVCFSVAQALVLPFFPEAPRYLFIEKGDDKACKKALQNLWGEGDYRQEMDEMLAEQAVIKESPPKSPLQLLRDRTVRWQLITMSIIYCCNQLSGVTVIGAFAFDIFLKAGMPKDQIRYVTLGIGVTEMITTFSCGLVIEHVGRKLLFWVGYGVMATCLVLVTVMLNLKDFGIWFSYITAGLVIIFIIFFGGGPGAAAGTLNNELFIQSNRVASLVLMGLLRWLVFALVGLIFPFLLDAFDSYCFVFSACVCLLGCLYTFLLLPETKGKTLLEISEEFKAITVRGRAVPEEVGPSTKL